MVVYIEAVCLTMIGVEDPQGEEGYMWWGRDKMPKSPFKRASLLPVRAKLLFNELRGPKALLPAPVIRASITADLCPGGTKKEGKTALRYR